ncbi:unnamed protein product [Nezara viridula]|uniref:Cytochrome P450 n=1 Tax=Nezara viridula TaxID=85310 RepID=A0A9P0E646_NEZVI|nr:unnamed protein product [Nezara viridula]
MILEIVIFLILSQLIFGLFLWYQVRDVYRYPNSFGFPVIGTLYDFYKGLSFMSLHNEYHYLKDISDRVGNGLYFAYVKGRRSVILSCPYIIEKISYNQSAAEKDPNTYGTVNPLIKGIFTYCSNDSEYKLRRKEVNNSLTKSLIDGPYANTFKRIGRKLTEDFVKNKDNLDLVYYCTNSALSIIKETHFGVENAEKNEDGRFFKVWIWILHFATLIFSNPLVAILFTFTYKIFDKVLMKKAHMLQAELGKSVKKHVRNTLKDPTAAPKYSTLSVVISLRNKSRNLDKFETKKELYELLLAGSHTAGTVLITSFAFMATLPEIQEKVWKEQYEIFGTSDRDPNIEDLKKMTYLERFIKEILRFFSPAFIGKVTTAEIKVGGVTIPAETVVYFLLGKAHMDPRFWKDPQVFNPDRAFEDQPKYAFAAFGVGVRSCPGMTYARQELKTIISIIIRKCKFFSQQKFEDFKYESHLMQEIVNLKPVRVEEREYLN